MAENQEPSETVKDVEYIAKAMGAARDYGLEVEVVAWALFALKATPTLTVREAIDYGYMEWIK